MEVRDVRKALGNETFSLFVDSMSDAEVKSVLTKLDKHHPDLKKSNAQWRRNQLMGLAQTEIEPTAKIAAPKKSKSARTSQTPKAASSSELPTLNREAMAAVRRRR